MLARKLIISRLFWCPLNPAPGNICHHPLPPPRYATASYTLSSCSCGIHLTLYLDIRSHNCHHHHDFPSLGSSVFALVRIIYTRPIRPEIFEYDVTYIATEYCYRAALKIWMLAKRCNKHGLYRMNTVRIQSVYKSATSTAYTIRSRSGVAAK